MRDPAGVHEVGDALGVAWTNVNKVEKSPRGLVDETNRAGVGLGLGIIARAGVLLLRNKNTPSSHAFGFFYLTVICLPKIETSFHIGVRGC